MCQLGGKPGTLVMFTGFIETVRPKAERMMRAHNRLNKRTKDLQEESKRINLEIDALALM